jgi:23S rRNA (uracil1939-C5)-methyltransferase
VSADVYVKPKPGHLIEVDIERLSVKGQGIGVYGEYSVTLRGGVPGDRVLARLRKVRHRRKECDARIVDRISDQVGRVGAKCEHFGVCGGCLWQDVPYEKQVKLKERIVREAVKPSDEVEIGTTLTAPSPLIYRNKMEFSVGQGEEGLVEIGLHPAGQFGSIFDLHQCELVSPITSSIVDSVRSFANDNRLPPYDLKTHKGLLRFLTVREGAQTGEIMVIVTTSEEPFDAVGGLAEQLAERYPQIKGVIHTTNREKAQVAYGDTNEIVQGRGSISDKLGPFTFDISPTSFFQPNTLQAERMFERVVSLAELEMSERVLDAYCGTGGISLFLSQVAGHVLGIEVSTDAIKDAARNSAYNQVTNCEFVSGPAEDLLGQLCQQGDRFDVAVTDPPRAGMHHKAIRGLIDLGPERIVYVSCNPKALANDVAILEAHGYTLDYLQLVDMLPQTPHCEVLARLRRG